MELEHIRISKPGHEDEETESPSRTEEVILLSCAFTRRALPFRVERTRRIDQKTKKRHPSLPDNLFLAVMTDAGHLLSDVAGLGVSLLAIKVSTWEANPRNSSGFKRLKVLADFLSVQLLKENINIQGAYLHAMADMIQSLGVLIGGGIIWVKPKWVLVDLICTLVFSAFPLAATLPMLKNIFWILMERAPREMDIEKVERGLKCIKGVKIVHGLHVWEITVERELYCLAMSCPNPVLVLKRSFLML
ncbi:hypothetical protein YC2023_050389 [Brassica napus]